MKRIRNTSLAWSVILLAILAGAARATPTINGASVETRTFNDCSLSTLTVSNNYPSSISITDVMDPLCVGFANLHSFSFSDDGGATAADFDNNSNMTYGADFKIEGAGEGEGGWGERVSDENGDPELTSLSDLLGWSRRGRAARV